MAESVDALVSNTSGVIRAGSTPALGTESRNLLFEGSDFFFVGTARASYPHKKRRQTPVQCVFVSLFKEGGN